MEKYWDAVSEALCDAVAIAWDECHKIYILLDEGQVDLMRGYGYDQMVLASESTDKAMLATIRGWWDQSCDLAFVDSVRTTPDPNVGFTTLIPQYAKDEGKWIFDEEEGW